MRGVVSFLAILSDRDDPWLCGYLEDMLYAFAASNCNMDANAADLYTIHHMSMTRTMNCPLE